MWRRVLVLAVFSIGFAYVESAIVVYLRTIFEPLQHHIDPNYRRGELFPLPSREQLQQASRWQQQQLGFETYLPLLLKVELGREFATMVMIFTVGLVCCKGFSWIHED